MDWIKKLKIANKLLLMLSLSLFFVTTVGIVGVFYTNLESNALSKIYNNCLTPIRDISKIIINSNANNAMLLAMLTSDSKEEKEILKTQINNNSDENSSLLDAYEAMNLSEKEKSLLEKLSGPRKEYKNERKKLISLAEAGKGKIGTEIYRKETSKIYAEYAEILRDLLKTNKDKAEEIHIKNEKDAKQAQIILILTLLSAFTLLILLSLTVSKLITDPIYKVVSELEEGSQQVASASEQLSKASHKLAEGSAEQSAAIQQTSASIEESDSMIKQNSDNTQQAAALATKTKNYANNSTHKINSMMSEMEELKKSSDEMAKIIKIIDDIAFQTNILALNAAVEAARAGDAGKGFAVVAEEVRNLAQKSALATKDTSKIIESNVNLSKNAATKTIEINEEMQEIDLQSKKMNDLLSEIAVASKEQSQGIEQINQAIRQMEMVIQNNASAAEESASASIELSEQAVNVKEIVNELLVMVNGT